MNVLEAAHRRCAALELSLANRDERLISAGRWCVRLEQVADAKQERIAELEVAMESNNLSVEKALCGLAESDAKLTVLRRVVGSELFGVGRHVDALSAMHVRLTEALSGSEPTPAGSASVDAEPPIPQPPHAEGHRKKKRSE